MSENIQYRDLLLSTQRALLGEVIATLRGVAIEVQNGNKIIIYYYHDGEVSEDLHDDFTSIGAEILADYLPPTTISEKIYNWPTPKPIPEHEFWAFVRKEVKGEKNIA